MGQLRLNAFIRAFLGCLLINAFFFGCVSVPPPTEDYALARAALDAARAIDASRFAPNTYQQAEVLYHKAQLLYEDHDYERAKVEFIKARRQAEKAETQSRVQKAIKGEIL